MAERQGSEEIQSTIDSNSKDALEHLPKTAAGLLAVIYGAGYLVTSLHNYSFGFSIISPFRPRIISAGGWFLLFVSLPVMLMHWARKNPYVRTREESRKNRHRESTTWLTFLAFSAISAGALAEIADGFSLPGTNPHDWSFWASTLFVAAIPLIFISDQLDLIPSSTALVIIYCIFAGLCICGINDIFIKHRVIAGSVMLWFFAVAWAGTIFCRFELRARPYWWPYLGSWLCIGLFWFSTSYYPRIQASWGGGAPIPITLIMTRDAAIVPGERLRVSLIEETEQGFYVTGAGDKSATFIPRNEVELIYYATDSSAAFFNYLH